MRLSNRILRVGAALCACAAVVLVISAGALAAGGSAAPSAPASPIGVAGAAAGSTAAFNPLTAPFDHSTQAHPGACSRTTLNVAQAVGDLNANGVLGQYAALVGVHATGAALLAKMRGTLVVEQVASQTVTQNHGCTTDGVIFGTGARTLTVGENVGVALPAAIRKRLCAGTHAGCERQVVTVSTVFPTNCWNLNQGTIRIQVFVLRPKRRHLVRHHARPSVSVKTSCGIGNPGIATLTLVNRRGANARAWFTVNGHRYGPIAPGASRVITVALTSGASTGIQVSSGGEILASLSDPPYQCAVTPEIESVPTASAALSCQAGGVVVTLANGADATADASFDVNGTSYGPLAPGASQNVTVAVSPGTSAQVTVTSGAQTLLTGTTYSNSCHGAASALASVSCAASWLGGGGGTLSVQLANAASATLPTDFVVTATGNTTSGYGPATLGPVAVGATQTLLIPVDASQNPVHVTISSGGTTLVDQTFAGCALQQQGE